MRKVGLTQVYHVGDELHFELNDGTVANFKYGKHKEGLLGLLFNLSEELDRVPTFEDVLNHPKMPHPNTFAFYFGSFGNAIEMVEGRRRFQRWREGKTLEKERPIEVKREPEEERKGGDEMSWKKWTKGEIIALVIRKEEELGHFPTQKDLQEDPELPSYQTVANKFGGLRELKDEVEDRKAKKEQAVSEEQTAIESLVELLSPEEPAKVAETLEEDEQETASKEVASAEEPEENPQEEDEPEIISAEVASEEEFEESPHAEDENEKTEPIKATVEVKDENGTKTIKLVLTLEISFPT